MSKKEKFFPLNTVGGRIQKLRHEMNLSRPDLYNSVYKNETSEFLSDSSKEKTVYNWESGRTELNYSTLCALCKTANYAQTECQFRYCGTAIPFLTVRSTAR